MFRIRKRRGNNLRFFLSVTIIEPKRMRIEKANQQQIKTTPSSEKKINKTVSQDTLSKAKSFTSDKTQFLSSHLDRLIVSLKSSKLLNLRGLSKALPPLNELLQILCKSSFNAHDSDVLLMEKFIKSWLEKYGESLPLKQKKGLIELSNLLRSRRLEAKDNEDHRLLFSHSSGHENDIPSWKIDYRKQKNSGSPEEEETIACVFDMETENLGNVRTTVTELKDQKNCLFVSSRLETAALIRNSLNVLTAQLKERGLEFPCFTVSGKRLDFTSKRNHSGKGLDLWG